MLAPLVFVFGCGDPGANGPIDPPVVDTDAAAVVGDRPGQPTPDAPASLPETAGADPSDLTDMRQPAPEAGDAPGLSAPDVPADELPPMDAQPADTKDAASEAAPDAIQRKPTPDGAGPYLLSEAGLYSDMAKKLLAADLIPFAPEHVLWADGATKRRWLQLPPGEKIDTSNMDHWTFPVGTRAWKEFSRDGKPLETRLVERTGPGEMDYWMGAFLWKADGSDAVYVPDGATNVLGTDHDVPAAKRCWSCHSGEPGRLLGFSAVQLSRPAGTSATLSSLVAAGLLTAPPPPDADYRVPGEGAVRTAIGYLHANCGHCHNPTGIARPDTDMLLRIGTSDRVPEATGAYRTTIGVMLQRFRNAVVSDRIVRASPDQSGVIYRMRERGTNSAMPPLATKHVDMVGVDLVSAWIRGL